MFADCRPEPAYITLVEALSFDGFKITEVSEGGSVPNLRVINETPHHVLLFDGEELKGAKQNRILNTTILIAAGSALDVPVSCTEQGRWSYDSPEFSTSGSLAYAELRKRKSAGCRHSLCRLMPSTPPTKARCGRKSSPSTWRPRATAARRPAR